jgi:hypothetical protein
MGTEMEVMRVTILGVSDLAQILALMKYEQHWGSTMDSAEFGVMHHTDI